MNGNNLQNISEEKLDRIAETILRSTILTDEEVEEIAESPRLWWQVQSRIAVEKERRQSGWFFKWQWATVGALAILIAAIASVWFANSPSQTQLAALDQQTIDPSEREIIAPEKKSEIAPENVSIIKKSKNTTAEIHKKAAIKNTPKSVRVQSSTTQIAKAKLKETKKTEATAATEFIALSYLPTVESGQIVRVKVPRSMMVSLGVTTKAEKTSELVNAEIVVGDDGAARAIRFLANE